MTTTDALAASLRGELPDGAAANARVRATFAARADEDGLVDVAYRTVDSPAGELLLAATADGVVKVSFGAGDDVLASLAEDVSPRVLRFPSRLDLAARQLDEYFAGRRQRFDLPLDLRLARGFRRHVLDELRDVALRDDGQLLRPGPGGGPAAGGARRRDGVCHEPHPDRHPVPPRAAPRRFARWVRRRPGGQARPPRPGAALAELMRGEPRASSADDAS